MTIVLKQKQNLKRKQKQNGWTINTSIDAAPMAVRVRNSSE